MNLELNTIGILDPFGLSDSGKDSMSRILQLIETREDFISAINKRIAERKYSFCLEIANVLFGLLPESEGKASAVRTMIAIPMQAWIERAITLSNEGIAFNEEPLPFHVLYEDFTKFNVSKEEFFQYLQTYWENHVKISVEKETESGVRFTFSLKGVLE